MTILHHAVGGSMVRAQVWAFGRLVCLECGDLRLVFAALLARLLTTIWKNIARRACQGAHFASRYAAADTTVAAGWR